MIAKNLLIIESPNKIATISKFLDSSWVIIATIGHIRELSNKGGFGVDEKTLEPSWIIPRNNPLFKNARPKTEIIAEIKNIASKAEHIFLATDPDREGEAIAWHVNEILDEADKYKVERITFNEITESAVKKALQHPRKIDINWVDSQFTRRILDRFLGYKLSKLLRSKHIGDSAGRVQSVALKFIYDREQQIKQFKETKTYLLNVTLENDIKIIQRSVSPKLKNIKAINDDDTAAAVEYLDEKSAQTVKDNLSDVYRVYLIDPPSKSSHQAPMPYKTSTMQQDAINKLGWSVAKATSVAQKLYEGINVKGNHIALISYPRTDSLRYADAFIETASKYIVDSYGKEYLNVRNFNAIAKKKEKENNNVQDGHESIRVIDPFMTPESLKPKLPEDEYKLYKLIWTRTIASLMSNSTIETTIIRLQNNDNKFYTYNTKLLFDGYKKIYKAFENNENEKIIPLSILKLGSAIKATDVEIKEKVTQPPPRYTQASLIKELDESGVGRPSTYKMMADKVLERGYAILDARAYKITETGTDVIESLEGFFAEYIDKNFTKEMEEHLDSIAEEGENWKEWILKDILPQLNKEVIKANKEIEVHEKVFEKVGKKCPECGADLVYKYAHRTNKKFIACSNYPKCKFSDSLPEDKPKEIAELCPLCHSHLVLRKGRRGNFIGCSNYPKCHFLKSEKETNEQALEHMKAREAQAKAKPKPVVKEKKDIGFEGVGNSTEKTKIVLLDENKKPPTKQAKKEDKTDKKPKKDTKKKK